MVVHALLLSNDSSIVFVVQVALGATDHDWDLAELNGLGGISLEKLGGLVAVFGPLSLLDVDINLGVDLISHVSDPSLMGKVWVDFTSPGVFHHGLGPGINLPKHYLVADVVVLRADRSAGHGHVLAADPDHVKLILVHTVCDHVLDEPIE